jgi:hypothetical protein
MTTHRRKSTRGLSASLLGLVWRGGLGLAIVLSAGAVGPQTVVASAATAADDSLASGFTSPPPSARPRVFWDWLNGNVSQEQITHDLEQMRRQGIGGAMIFQVSVDPVPGGSTLPQGVTFMSDEWRGLFRHAVSEAARLGLEIGLMNSSGWNCGGPWISPAHAGRRLVWSETRVSGPKTFSAVLPPPTPQVDGGRHVPFQPQTVVDIAVLAIPAKPGGRPIKDWQLKAGYREVEGTTPDFLAWVGEPAEDEEGIALASVLDLTGQLEADGKLRWNVPEGDWIILRLAHALGGRERLCSGPGPGGPMLDHLSAEALDVHFRATAEKLIADAGELAGKTFTFLECDSCDLGTVNWTPRFAAEFKRRRGYEIGPYLPALTGRVVVSRRTTERFLYDFRKTIGDCIADNHYGRFRDLCDKHGLECLAEAGGPPPVPIDALRCYSRTAVPMGEFWAEGHTMHVRGAASAAHTNGRRLVAAEAFTSWAHWTQGPFELKPYGDRAFCEGMNRCYIHGFASSPPAAGKPGYVYYAGTHFEPSITWWEQSHGWIDYLTRCQFMLQQGLPVTDVCCYYGEQVPNFIPPRRDYWYELCPSLGEDYACDFADVETLLARVQVRDGTLVLPDGMTYRLLAFPDAIAKDFPCHREFIPIELLKKLANLVTAGATIVWPRPSMAPGLRDYLRCDEEIAAIARELWGPEDRPIGDRRVGKGRVIWGKTPRQVLLDDGVMPDFEHRPLVQSQQQRLSYCHRRFGDTEIYFVANRDTQQWIDATCWFRVRGKLPELWHPDNGKSERQMVFDEIAGRTWMPLRLPPAGSIFVVFRPGSDSNRIIAVEQDGRTLFASQTADATDLTGLTIEADDRLIAAAVAAKPGEYVFHRADGKTSSARVESIPAPLPLPGPWTLRFSGRMGAPDEVILERLLSWTEHEDPGVRYFSGTAVYQTEFSLPTNYLATNRQVCLDLGVVKNVAEVSLNGRQCGLLWKMPFRVDVTAAIQTGKNQLEVRITNLWPNRLIGDTFLPEERRFTRTNMSVFKQQSPLLESGLIGPVELRVSECIPLEWILKESTPSRPLGGPVSSRQSRLR